MAKRQVRTRMEEQLVSDEFHKLFVKFKPVFGDIENIRLVALTKKIGEWQRLLENNKGKKMESTYRKRLYDDQKKAIADLKFYFKKRGI